MNTVEHAPLKSVKVIEKLKKGSADVVIEDNAKISFVRWKDNKVVTVISSKNELNSTAKRKKKKRKTVHQGEKSSSRYWVTSMHQKTQRRNGWIWFFGSKIAM